MARLIWRAMMATDASGRRRSDAALKARFRWNKSGGSHFARSQLMHELANTAWVPQGGVFVKPADAVAEELPQGFTYDPGAAWLKAIQFGENHIVQAARAKEEAARVAAEHDTRESAAQVLGFPDVETAERALRFAELPPEAAERVLAEFNRTLIRELPEQETRNTERRSQTVFTQAADAPEKHSVVKLRSVAVGQSGTKVEAKEYLAHQYTNDTELFCQICKTVMPFKLDTGDYYFEAEPMFSDLSRLHPQNHLALCPNHAAMFRYALGSRDDLHGRLAALRQNELPITLASEETSVYFTKNHLADLQAVLRAEQPLDVEENGAAATDMS
jgi:hypothetical protein